MFAVCCALQPFSTVLILAPINRFLILVRQSPPPAICVCSLVALQFQRERDEESALCSPFEGVCHTGPVYSLSHCSTFDISLSLKALTHALFHECLSYLFKGAPLNLFPVRPDLLFSINPVIFLLTFLFPFCEHQMIFAYDKLPLNVCLFTQ